jgi:outer membrane protein assembly factor BamB
MFTACSRPVANIDPAETWTMYQRTPDHNAVIPRDNFELAWKMDAGDKINGGLAVIGDVLYIPTFGNKLIAIDVRKKQILWTSHADNVLMSTPVVADGLVFVGSGTNQWLTKKPSLWGSGTNPWGRPQGDYVYAFDATNGALRWKFHTVGEDMASPVYYRGAIIFANGDFHAYALDAKTGKLLWQRKIGGIATMSSAILAENRVVVSICRFVFPYTCETDAIEPLTGNVVWRAPYGHADASPAYGDGMVYVSGLEPDKPHWPYIQKEFPIVVAIDAATGNVRWKYRSKVAGLPSAVGSSERAIAGTYSAGTYYQALPGLNKLVAFDAKSGRTRWQLNTTAPVKMSPVVAGSRLYFGGIAGVLYSVNASNGNLHRVWTFNQSFATSPPVIVGGTIFIATTTTVNAIPLRWVDTHFPPGRKEGT